MAPCDQVLWGSPGCSQLPCGPGSHSWSVTHRPSWTCGCAGRRPGRCGNPAPKDAPLMPVVVILTTDTSSASEDEGSLQRPGRLASAPLQSRPSVEPWPEPAIQGSSTSSSASSTSSHPGGQPAVTPSAAAALAGPAALARVGQYSCGDPSRQRSPRPSSDPPSPLCMESVLLVTKVVSGASVVWQPQTLGGPPLETWTRAGASALEGRPARCPWLSGGLPPATRSFVPPFCAQPQPSVVPVLGVPRWGWGCSHGGPFFLYTQG